MMRVGELSKHGGVGPQVIRYYSRIGLLRPVRHPGNNYRLFSFSDLTRLRFIRQAQGLGFTLEEIARILDDSSRGKSPCPKVRDTLRQRIEANRQKLQELTVLQRRMERALRQWKCLPDGLPDEHTVCHLIESVESQHHHA